MIQHDEVRILVPTYNEAATIADVVERFREMGFENILVIDGGSSDGTRDIAEEAGADVAVQSGSGKGQAVREGVRMTTEPYVLLIDGDSTYRPEEAGRLLAPLFAGEAEHVVGDRFADMEAGAMSRLNQVGNGVMNRVFRTIHRRDLQDILSGYRAFTRDSFHELSLSEDGFGIETEMSVECVRHNVRTQVVPITYEARPEDSETNLHPFRDGATIILTLYRMAKMNNPLFYFGSLGAISGLAGVVLAAYVAYKWFVFSISHNVLALAAGVALLFGVQLVMFGVLSDLILTAHREQSRRIDRLAEHFEATDQTAVSDSVVSETDIGTTNVSAPDGGETESDDPTREVSDVATSDATEES